MPSIIRSPKLHAFGPFLLMKVLDTAITHVGFFQPPIAPVRVSNPTNTALRATPIGFTPHTLTSYLDVPTPPEPALKPSPLSSPTSTVPSREDNAQLLLLTWLTGLTLFLSILITVPWLYVLFSRLSPRTWIRNHTPSLQAALYTIVVSVVLLRWPGLQEYPVDEIRDVVSYFWQILLSRHQVLDDARLDASMTDQDFDSTLLTSFGSHSLVDDLDDDSGLLDTRTQRVAIILEKRVDGSLWVVEFDHVVDTPDAILDDSNCGVQKLATRNDQATTIDLADVKTRFTHAPDLLPSAPWRVVGSHIDPVGVSFTGWVENPAISFYPLDTAHGAKHFCYSQSHDSDTENPFWNSSPAAQRLAWSLIRSQSILSTSACGVGVTDYGTFYQTLGIDPYMERLEEKIAVVMGEMPDPADEIKQQIDREVAEFKENLNRRVARVKDMLREWNERSERHDALWNRRMRRRKYKSSENQAGWRAGGRLRPRRTV